MGFIHFDYTRVKVEDDAREELEYSEADDFIVPQFGLWWEL